MGGSTFTNLAGLPSVLGAPFSVVTYRSRLLATDDPDVIDDVLVQARHRNRLLGVTGTLFYDRGEVFQWLEGPTDSVEEIWASIARDPRHKDIELISRTDASRRLFGQSDMKFVRSSSVKNGEADPVLAGQRNEVARAAVQGDVDAIVGMFDHSRFACYGLAVLYSQVLTPAARLLGDEWLNDRCTELELSVGMLSLQQALRRFAIGRLERSAENYPPCSLLIASLPNEQHILGCSMAADTFWAAGWSVDIAFPKSTALLQKQVQRSWYHAVILCLSDALARDDRVVQAKNFIAAVRKQSRNKDIAVIVAGRGVLEGRCTPSNVGADACYHDIDTARSRVRAAMVSRVSTADKVWIAGLSRTYGQDAYARH